MDHFFQIPGLGGVTDRMLESWNTLSFVAGKTERLKLGTMVTGVTSRHSDVLIKTATTLDVFSGGPTSASAPEGSSSSISHSGFPSHRSGSDLMLEETLQIALRMWAGNTEPYNGRYCHLAEPINVPNSVQRPHPPILIGGGERKTLRLVARYEDACNFFADPTGCCTSSTCFALIVRLKGGPWERSKRRPWNGSPCPERPRPWPRLRSKRSSIFSSLASWGSIRR